jgi:hypothetical protein
LTAPADVFTLRIVVRSSISKRLVSLAALLPLLAFAASGVTGAHCHCALTGAVIYGADDDCCAGEDAPSSPVVSAPRCCEREAANVVRPPVEPTAPVPLLSCVELPAAAPLLAPPPTSASVPTAASFSGPRPPLLVLKQSFLL